MHLGLQWEFLKLFILFMNIYDIKQTKVI